MKVVLDIKKLSHYIFTTVFSLGGMTHQTAHPTTPTKRERFFGDIAFTSTVLTR
jgi:hypothetical protein